MLQYVCRARCLYSSKWTVRRRAIASCRSFSIQTGDCEPPVDGTYHRSQVHVEDGRVFTFATLVVNNLEGQSALPAWSHACSLLGANMPTLAVAFVSRNTPSSAAAIEELGKSYTDMLTIENNAPLHPKFNAPFVGCIADVWSVGAPASTSPGDGGGGNLREKRVGCSTAYRKVPFAATGGDTGNNEVKVVAEDSEEEDFKALVGESAKWTRENPGVVPDEDALLTLDKELKSRKSGSSQEGEETTKAMADREKEESTKLSQTIESKGIPVEADSKRLGGLKHVPEGASAGQGASVDTSMTGTEPSEQVAGQDTCTSISEDSPDSQTSTVEHEVEVLSVGARSSHQTRKSASDRRRQSSRDGTVDTMDESYRMILCLAHMPGTKAAAFHTTTTGLPSLPEMEAAVTKNNPHMFLLGAPGYSFPEFVQRLSIVFPESCRAGAFLSPLYNSPRMQRSSAVDDSKPLFAGAKQLSSGVVGIALSTEGDGSVPMNAFTEFLRLSLGMARVPGHTFFDNAISNYLFFPKNALTERQNSARSTPLDPNALLKRLNTYLIRHSKVQSQRNVGAVSASSGSSDSATSVEVKSSYELQPSSTSPAQTSTSPAWRDDQLLVEESDEMPLALMDTVLFPGWSMPLHIHEPRYRHLVRHCVEEGKPFGLTSYWHWQNSEELVGTMANLKVYLFEKDCRSYIVAHGVQRFRLFLDKMWVQPGTFGLNMGRVLFFDDDESEQKEELLELAKQVVDRCRQLIPEAESAPGLIGSVTDPTKASFAVGQLLPVPVRVKKRWLGMADTKFRLLEQMTFLNS